MSDRPSHDHDEHEKPRSHRLAGFIVLAVFAALAAWGIASRVEAEKTLDSKTEEQAVPTVAVLKVKSAAASETVVLPGNVQAWHEAPIFARTNGYLKEWKTDIGTPVKAGDLLAEIDTPEVDAQLHQAQADLGTAQANNQLAQSTAERWRALLKTNSVSKQDADEKISAAMASAATVAASQANLDRLQQLESFKKVVAPFDGVITARNTDTGALINAGSSGTGLELFHIAETGKLRVYVQVPESYTPAVTPDMTAELHFAEHPGKTFEAKLARTANALDPVTRTLLIELEVDNEKGELMPGGYTEVHLKLPTSAQTVLLPVNTLLFRAEGLQVATLDGEGNVTLKPVKVSRDFGKDVEVQSGIAPGETIVVNPPDSLANGQKVKIATPKDKKAGNGDAKADKDKDGVEKSDDDSGNDKKQ